MPNDDTYTTMRFDETAHSVTISAYESPESWMTSGTGTITCKDRAIVRLDKSACILCRLTISSQNPDQSETVIRTIDTICRIDLADKSFAADATMIMDIQTVITLDARRTDAKTRKLDSPVLYQTNVQYNPQTKQIKQTEPGKANFEGVVAMPHNDGTYIIRMYRYIHPGKNYSSDWYLPAQNPAVIQTREADLKVTGIIVLDQPHYTLVRADKTEEIANKLVYASGTMVHVPDIRQYIRRDRIVLIPGITYYFEFVAQSLSYPRDPDSMDITDGVNGVRTLGWMLYRDQIPQGWYLSVPLIAPRNPYLTSSRIRILMIFGKIRLTNGRVDPKAKRIPLEVAEVFGTNIASGIFGILPTGLDLNFENKTPAGGGCDIPVHIFAQFRGAATAEYQAMSLTPVLLDASDRLVAAGDAYSLGRTDEDIDLVHTFAVEAGGTYIVGVRLMFDRASQRQGGGTSPSTEVSSQGYIYYVGAYEATNDKTISAATIAPTEGGLDVAFEVRSVSILDQETSYQWRLDINDISGWRTIGHKTGPQLTAIPFASDEVHLPRAGSYTLRLTASTDTDPSLQVGEWKQSYIASFAKIRVSLDAPPAPYTDYRWVIHASTNHSERGLQWVVSAREGHAEEAVEIYRHAVGDFRILDLTVTPQMFRLPSPGIYIIRVALQSKNGEELEQNEIAWESTDIPLCGYIANHNHTRYVPLYDPTALPSISRPEYRILQDGIQGASASVVEPSVDPTIGSMYTTTVALVQNPRDLTLQLLVSAPPGQLAGAVRSLLELLTMQGDTPDDSQVELSLQSSDGVHRMHIRGYVQVSQPEIDELVPRTAIISAKLVCVESMWDGYEITLRPHARECTVDLRGTSCDSPCEITITPAANTQTVITIGTKPPLVIDLKSTQKYKNVTIRCDLAYGIYDCYVVDEDKHAVPIYYALDMSSRWSLELPHDQLVTVSTNGMIESLSYRPRWVGWW